MTGRASKTFDFLLASVYKFGTLGQKYDVHYCSFKEAFWRVIVLLENLQLMVFVGLIPAPLFKIRDDHRIICFELFADQPVCHPVCPSRW